MKHRVNKNQRERVVVFVASEITDKEEHLLQVARNFRRNNTNLDIVNVLQPKNLEILGKIIEVVNVEDESRLVNFDDNSSSLLDFVKASPIMGNQ